jgi:hypothetical protein
MIFNELPDWEQKLLIALHILLVLACLFAFGVCCRILLEHYGCLDRSKNRENDGKKKQRPSQPDDSAS